MVSKAFSPDLSKGVTVWECVKLSLIVKTDYWSQLNDPVFITTHLFPPTPATTEIAITILPFLVLGSGFNFFQANYFTIPSLAQQ